MATKKLTTVVIDALEDIKARDIKLINVAKLTSVFDYIAVASADSTRQTKALAKHVMDKVKEFGGWIYGMEGEQSGEWVLVDCGDVVVHIMQPVIREHYKIEELWGEGRLEYPKPVATKRKPAVAGVAKKAKATGTTTKRVSVKAKAVAVKPRTAKAKTPTAKVKTGAAATSTKAGKVKEIKKTTVKTKVLPKKTVGKVVAKVPAKVVKKVAPKVDAKVAKKVVKKVAKKVAKKAVTKVVTPVRKKGGALIVKKSVAKKPAVKKTLTRRRKTAA